MKFVGKIFSFFSFFFFPSGAAVAPLTFVHFGNNQGIAGAPTPDEGGCRKHEAV